MLGLIAGCGRLPLEVARSARRRGHAVAAVAFRGLADRAIEDETSRVTWLHPGEVDAAIRALRSAGVHEAVMAGKVPKTILYADPGSLRLDGTALRLIRGLSDRRDDSILGLVAKVLEGEGIRLLAQTELIPELVAREGVLGAVKPTPEQLADAAFGWPVAKAIGGLDVGQTVVVRDGAVLAVEAVEGTDAAILRGGGYAAGACVVKVAKPDQDPRFDVPTVGLDTVEALASVGARLLVLESGRTVILDPEAVVARADREGIALLGASSERLPGSAP